MKLYKIYYIDKDGEYRFKWMGNVSKEVAQQRYIEFHKQGLKVRLES